MITRRPWFGPKRFGLGVEAGELARLARDRVFLVVVLGACFGFGSSPATVYISIAAFAALVAICFLTGTPPGRQRDGRG